MMEQKYIDYLKKYSFKHPIEYSKHKTLSSIVQEDLEIDTDSSKHIELYLQSNLEKKSHTFDKCSYIHWTNNI